MNIKELEQAARQQSKQVEAELAERKRQYDEHNRLVEPLNRAYHFEPTDGTEAEQAAAFVEVLAEAIAADEVAAVLKKLPQPKSPAGCRALIALRQIRDGKLEQAAKQLAKHSNRDGIVEVVRSLRFQVVRSLQPEEKPVKVKGLGGRPGTGLGEYALARPAMRNADIATSWNSENAAKIKRNPKLKATAKKVSDAKYRMRSKTKN